ncbi:MAG TPA: DNA-3-methyladenine glycosylase [Candidatus Paceibacterota bacterium]|nr:DNA-3-methyladenine glycosylase [Candidatus Paceibacterota bacterium]
MSKVLNAKFFEHQTVAVAKLLLGKYLCRRIRGKTIRAMITETEAYDGPKDAASHAHKGITPRNIVMFGPAGYWYVYFTYGMHWMLNVVTGKKGFPAAVLIRGVKGVSGPGRVTKSFGIDLKFNGLMANRKTGLWIEDKGVKIPKSKIGRSKRVGVDYAGPVWSNKHYRFYVK